MGTISIYWDIFHIFHNDWDIFHISHFHKPSECGGSSFQETPIDGGVVVDAAHDLDGNVNGGIDTVLPSDLESSGTIDDAGEGWVRMS